MKDIFFQLLKLKTTKDNIPALEESIDIIISLFQNNKNVFIKKFIFNNKPSVVISTRENKDFDIILNGHLDVVPADYPKAFEPYEKNGKIYARGASDMKGGDIAIIYAFKEVIEKNPTANIALMLTTDEEIGGFNGVKALLEKEHFSAQCVFIPDSAENFGICLDEKGLIHVTIETKGILSHGSRPWLGENAIENAINIYQEIKSLLDKKYKLATAKDNWKTTVNLGVLEGGKATNVVPDKALMKLDIRFPAPITVNEIKDIIKPIVQKYNGKITNTLEGHSLHTEKNNEYIQNWIEILEKNNIDYHWVKGHGASDGRFFSKKGIPVFLAKPKASNPHIENEWIDWDSLVKFKNIVREWIEKSLS